MYILCKHMRLKYVVTSLALQQIKEVGAATRQEDILSEIECACKNTVVHNFDAKFITFRLMVFVILHPQKLKLGRGHLFLQCS